VAAGWSGRTARAVDRAGGRSPPAPVRAGASPGQPGGSSTRRTRPRACLSGRAERARPRAAQACPRRRRGRRWPILTRRQQRQWPQQTCPHGTRRKGTGRQRRQAVGSQPLKRRSLLAVAAVSALLVPALVSAPPAAKKKPKGYASTALNVLAPGEAPDSGPNSTDQLALYDGLTPLWNAVSRLNVRNHFKRETFGLSGKATRVEDTGR